MTIYLSNPTKQNFVFHYRLWAERAEDRLLRHVSIPSGGQAEIGHGWSADQTNRVLEQLHLHGAREVSDMWTGNAAGFLGLAYRLDKVVKSDEIEIAHSKVVETQEKRSAAEATKAALGFDRSMNQGGRGQRRVKVSGVEVQQQVAPGERLTGNEMSFSLSVDPEGRSDVQLPS